MYTNITSRVLTMRDLFTGSTRYSVPGWQRGYVWKSDEIKGFWAEHLQLLNQGRKVQFFGSIILTLRSNRLDDEKANRSDDEKAENFEKAHAAKNFYIIDGQQRIVTWSLLLATLRDLCIEAGGDNRDRKQFQESLFVPDAKRKQEVTRVVLAERDESAYEYIMLEQTRAALEDAEARTQAPKSDFYSAYSLLRSLVLEFIGSLDAEDRLTRIRWIVETLLLASVCVVVEVNDFEFALQVFEKMERSYKNDRIPEPKPTKSKDAKQFPRASEIAQIFFSYSHADATTMKTAKDFAVRLGFRVWTDDKLKPGTPSWKRSVEEAIEKAGALILLTSPNAKKSDWVSREVSYARLQEVDVFPILIDGDDRKSLSLELSEYQWVDGRAGKLEAGLLEILQTIYVKAGKRT